MRINENKRIDPMGPINEWELLNQCRNCNHCINITTSSLEKGYIVTDVICTADPGKKKYGGKYIEECDDFILMPILAKWLENKQESKEDGSDQPKT